MYPSIHSVVLHIRKYYRDDGDRKGRDLCEEKGKQSRRGIRSSLPAGKAIGASENNASCAVNLYIHAGQCVCVKVRVHSEADSFECHVTS